ncbi:hypothetical protein SteCoe_9966 [Stentor coeruleus]|uniref:Uncharacterized protein n=1 Tax=Stentor coeruleus TaxID=5963 RepID=A0A1R2CGJ7_9CILI|nr:hypothetical protein SteCoe_9966 [Stentor coeruleus]
MPKHLLKNRDEVSPYSKSQAKNSLLSRISICSKKPKSALTRGHTMASRNEESMTTLIKIEREYVRELIKSPIKQTSKSTLLTNKNKHKLISPNKTKAPKNRFESLTACDFLPCTHIKKKPSESKRLKISFTPDILNRKK